MTFSGTFSGTSSAIGSTTAPLPTTLFTDLGLDPKIAVHFAPNEITACLDAFLLLNQMPGSPNSRTGNTSVMAPAPALDNETVMALAVMYTKNKHPVLQKAAQGYLATQNKTAVAATQSKLPNIMQQVKQKTADNTCLKQELMLDAYLAFNQPALLSSGRGRNVPQQSFVTDIAVDKDSALIIALHYQDHPHALLQKTAAKYLNLQNDDTVAAAQKKYKEIKNDIVQHNTPALLKEQVLNKGFLLEIGCNPCDKDMKNLISPNKADRYLGLIKLRKQFNQQSNDISQNEKEKVYKLFIGMSQDEYSSVSTEAEAFLKSQNDQEHIDELRKELKKLNLGNF